MIRHAIIFYSIILVLIGGDVNNQVSASEAMASTGQPAMSVEEFVHQIYFEGLPYDKASQYGPDAVPKLLAMLKDPNEKPYRSNIIVTLGVIGILLTVRDSS